MRTGCWPSCDTGTKGTGATADGSRRTCAARCRARMRRASTPGRAAWCWLFVAVDHWVSDVLGWHVANKGSRCVALEPIHRRTRPRLDGDAPRIALGLGLRRDRGTQYAAHQFNGKLTWLRICSFAEFGSESECSGIAERFIPTLKEECLCHHDFKNVEDARHKISQFTECYNRAYLLERNGYRTAARVRQEFTVIVASITWPLVQELGTGSRQ